MINDWPQARKDSAKHNNIIVVTRGRGRKNIEGTTKTPCCHLDQLINQVISIFFPLSLHQLQPLIVGRVLCPVLDLVWNHGETPDKHHHGEGGWSEAAITSQGLVPKSRGSSWHFKVYTPSTEPQQSGDKNKGERSTFFPFSASVGVWLSRVGNAPSSKWKSCHLSMPNSWDF